MCHCTSAHTCHVWHTHTISRNRCYHDDDKSDCTTYTQFVIIFITCSSDWYPIWNGSIKWPIYYLTNKYYTSWSSSTVSIFHHLFLSLAVVFFFFFYCSSLISQYCLNFTEDRNWEFYSQPANRTLCIQIYIHSNRRGRKQNFFKDQMKAIVFTRDSAIALFEMYLEIKQKQKHRSMLFILIFYIFICFFDVKLMTMGARMERKRIIH